MTKITKAQKREAVTNYLCAKYPDAKVDRWGNIKLQRGKSEYRYKIQERVVRLESKALISDHHEWVRIKSYPLSELYQQATSENQEES